MVQQTTKQLFATGLKKQVSNKQVLVCVCPEKTAKAPDKESIEVVTVDGAA